MINKKLAAAATAVNPMVEDRVFPATEATAVSPMEK